jgi:uncharacterized protein YdeI (YjbR/CyaY-like superfamily)
MSASEIFISDSAQLRDWLQQNHHTSQGVWVVYNKGPKRTITVDEIIDQCLCFGWVDSKPGKVDAQKTKFYISPRNPKSNWSAVNKKKVEKLIQEDLMTDYGITVVNLAKKSGTWDTLNDVDNLVSPDDLVAELKKYPKAESNFNQFTKSVRRGILEWILNAKRPETRQTRIQETARLAQDNIRANQWHR